MSDWATFFGITESSVVAACDTPGAFQRVTGNTIRVCVNETVTISVPFDSDLSGKSMEVKVSFATGRDTLFTAEATGTEDSFSFTIPRIAKRSKNCLWSLRDTGTGEVVATGPFEILLAP